MLGIWKWWEMFPVFADCKADAKHVPHAGHQQTGETDLCFFWIPGGCEPVSATVDLISAPCWLSLIVLDCRTSQSINLKTFLKGIKSIDFNAISNLNGHSPASSEQLLRARKFLASYFFLNHQTEHTFRFPWTMIFILAG